ncbi:MAG: hypothetical protein WA210_20655 [Burkholderiaceae bacterium]
MTHPVKPSRHKRAPTRSPARVPVNNGPAEDGPPLPDGPARPPRIDIERTDDAKLGSIQALPPAEPVSGVAGFVESAGDQDGDSHLPPCLEQN